MNPTQPSADPHSPGDRETASPAPSGAASKGAWWTGWVLTAVPGLLLLLDAVMKFVKPDFVVEGTVKIGFSEDVILPLGVVLLVSVVLYLVPRTAVLGAILLTGYLGGAVSIHVRAGDGAFEIVFPVVFGVVLWLGLFLRDRRLRELVPWRTCR